MGFLTDLVDERRRELERRPLDDSMLLARALAVPPARDFVGALRARAGRPAVIAEIKRASPSAGAIADRDAGERARAYASAGAAAISVLTDGPYFGGSIEDLKAAVRQVPVPVLRKDFILDEVQVLQARAAGAAAVLLIVRALGPRLRPLLGYTMGQGLDALVEVHTPDELVKALDAGATILGINSRDLDTFRIDVSAAWKIVSQVPAGCIAVAESGMLERRDVVDAAEAGADAVLIGTALSAAASPERLLDEFTRVRRHDR